jgi:hypothetical protein
MTRFLVSFSLLVACVPPPDHGAQGKASSKSEKKDASPDAENSEESGGRLFDEVLGEGSPCAAPGELGEPRNPDITDLGTMTMLATIPESRATWTRSSRDAAPAGGTKRRWMDSVQATVADGKRRATISITDMKSMCTIEPGTGDTMVRRAMADPEAEPTRVAGRVGVAFKQGAYSMVNFWSGDRCAVTVGAPALSHADLVDAVEAIDIDALDALCAGRATGTTPPAEPTPQ